MSGQEMDLAQIKAHNLRVPSGAFPPPSQPGTALGPCSFITYFQPQKDCVQLAL